MAAIIRFDLDVSKMSRQGGCCTTVIVQRYKLINKKKEKVLPLYSIISMKNESNPFLCDPAVLGSRKLATGFLSHLFYSHFSIVKYENSIVLNSVPRHCDVMLGYIVMMM